MGREYPVTKTRIGKLFGQWTIIGIGYIPANRKYRKYLCRCACGATSYVSMSNLVDGRSTRCRTCGYKAAGIKSMNRAASRIGQKYIPKTERPGLCLDCGCGINSTTSKIVIRCRRCSGLIRRGVPYGPRKHPRTFQDVANEIGISKQAVSRRVKLVGWNGMLSYYGVSKT